MKSFVAADLVWGYPASYDCSYPIVSAILKELPGDSI
jgi:hypothetical protein